MKIEGNTFIVTGGASGLGEATTKYLHSRKANVVIFDMNEKMGQALESELGKDRCLFAKCNITSEESVQKGLDDTVAKFGKFVGVINCAGLGFPQKLVSSRGAANQKDFDLTFKVNVSGTWNVIRLAVLMMKTMEPDANGDRGVIVMTSSIAAVEGQQGQIAYSGSKAALDGMTLPMARELGVIGVRVMCIAPGVFVTPLSARGMNEDSKKVTLASLAHPKRLGDAQEYAFLVAHIVENNYLNGTTLRIDGGQRLAKL
eukprot:gene11187-13033_t